MKAFIFPGFDSLEIREQRNHALVLSAVRACLEQANQILNSTRRAQPIDLFDFIRSEDEVFNRYLDLKIVSSIAVQTGVFEHLANRMNANDLIVGCSLGDLARNVCAGIASFEDVIRGGYQFGQRLMIEKVGEICRCSSLDAMTVEELENFLPKGLYLSVYQTPRHFLISGPAEITEQWLTQNALNFRVSKLADLPLHSPLMHAAAEAMRQTIVQAEIKSPQKKVFSSLEHREVLTPHEYAKETADNIVKKVDWVQTLKIIIEEKGVEELVSVGPASTLLRFAERTPVSQECKRTDGFAEVLKEVGARR